MYKCLDCGHIFDDGEQKIIQENHPYGDTTAPEYFSVCPCCEGDFEKTERCKCCEGEFLEDELIGGYCKECFRDALTVEDFLAFATEGEQETKISTLEDFIFTKIFNLPKVPCESSADSKRMCHKIYVMYSDLQSVIEYMDEIPSLWDDFADYLQRKGVK